LGKLLLRAHDSRFKTPEKLDSTTTRYSPNQRTFTRASIRPCSQTPFTGGNKFKKLGFIEYNGGLKVNHSLSTPSRVSSADHAGGAQARHQPEPGTHELHRRHQREREKGRPERQLAKRGACHRIGRDARRIIVRRAGNQARAEVREEPSERVPLWPRYGVNSGLRHRSNRQRRMDGRKRSCPTPTQHRVRQSRDDVCAFENIRISSLRIIVRASTVCVADRESESDHGRRSSSPARARSAPLTSSSSWPISWPRQS
jgi:hypothetical protein